MKVTYRRESAQRELKIDYVSMDGVERFAVVHDGSCVWVAEADDLRRGLEAVRYMGPDRDYDGLCSRVDPVQGLGEGVMGAAEVAAELVEGCSGLTHDERRAIGRAPLLHDAFVRAVETAAALAAEGYAAEAVEAALAAAGARAEARGRGVLPSEEIAAIRGLDVPEPSLDVRAAWADDETGSAAWSAAYAAELEEAAQAVELSWGAA